MGQNHSVDSYEVIAVDNASTDNSADVARQFPDVRLLSENRPGAYHARNCGLTAASGDLIVFTDADCVPRTDWLEQMEAELADPSLQVVMGRDLPAGKSLAVRLLGTYDHFKEAYALSSTEADIYYGHTNCMGTRRSLFEELGFFDGRPRGADVIFVQRVLERYGVESVRYQPEAVVEHTEINSAWVYFKKAFIYGRSARSYQRLVSARPLRNAERRTVFRQVVKSSGLTGLQSSYLLAMLTVGVAFYGLGWASLAGEREP